MDDLLEIKASSIAGRVGLILIVLVVLLLSWFAVRSQVGNMLAELTSTADPNLNALSQAAVRWAPGDPRAHILRASAAGDPQISLADLEQAVRSAPFDFRWRVTLARGYEQNEQLPKAEAEFRKAVELAPNYAYTHWHFGNFLLRRERPDEAMAELSVAARGNSFYRDQVFSLLWDSFGHDPAPIERMASQSSEGTAYGAYFLAGKGAAANALSLWKTLSPEDADKYAFRVPQMATALFNNKHFSEAWAFTEGAQGRTGDVPGFTNGSFEKPLPESEAALFDWRVEANDPRVEMSAVGKTAAEGERSLRIAFRNFTKPVFANPSQTALIEPGMAYELIFSAKTEDLRTSVPIVVQIMNACDNTVLARSGNISSGSNPWAQMHVPFTSGPSCSAIEVRAFREGCGEGCPVSGTVFLDDFKLQKK